MFGKEREKEKEGRLPRAAKVIGAYELTRKLGEGSFSRVFSAVHVGTRAGVALKVIQKSKVASAKLQSNLENEIRIMRDYLHPNVASLAETFTQGRYIVLVLELCQGDLSHFLRARGGCVAESIAVPLLHQLSVGLAFLSTKGVIHRDIKPANLLLCARQGGHADFPLLKISDYGFARHLTEAAQMAATPCGTPLYMAPEIYLMQDYDGRVDVWSCGCVFFEMLCGSPPWAGGSSRELFMNIRSQGLVVPPSCVVSHASRSLLGRLLETSPRRRPQLGAFCAAVQRLQELTDAAGASASVAQTAAAAAAGGGGGSNEDQQSSERDLEQQRKQLGASSSSFVMVDRTCHPHCSATRGRSSSLRPEQQQQREEFVADCDHGTAALLHVVPLGDELVQEADAYLACCSPLLQPLLGRTAGLEQEAWHKARQKLARAAAIYLFCMRHLRGLLLRLQDVPHSAADAASVACTGERLRRLLQGLLGRLQRTQQLAGGGQKLELPGKEAEAAIVAHSRNMQATADAAQLQGQQDAAGRLRRCARLALLLLK